MKNPELTNGHGRTVIWTGTGITAATVLSTIFFVMENDKKTDISYEISARFPTVISQVEANEVRSKTNEAEIRYRREAVAHIAVLREQSKRNREDIGEIKGQLQRMEQKQDRNQRDLMQAIERIR